MYEYNNVKLLRLNVPNKNGRLYKEDSFNELPVDNIPVVVTKDSLQPFSLGKSHGICSNIRIEDEFLKGDIKLFTKSSLASILAERPSDISFRPVVSFAVESRPMRDVNIISISPTLKAVSSSGEEVF